MDRDVLHVTVSQGQQCMHAGNVILLCCNTVSFCFFRLMRLAKAFNVSQRYLVMLSCFTVCILLYDLYRPANTLVLPVSVVLRRQVRL